MRTFTTLHCSSTVYLQHNYCRQNDVIVTRGRLGRLAAWNLAGGPIGPACRWFATSNVEVGQTTYPVNTEKVGMEGRDDSEGQNHKEEEREEGSEMGKGLRCP